MGSEAFAGTRRRKERGASARLVCGSPTNLRSRARAYLKRATASVVESLQCLKRKPTWRLTPGCFESRTVLPLRRRSERDQPDPLRPAGTRQHVSRVRASLRALQRRRRTQGRLRESPARSVPAERDNRPSLLRRRNRHRRRRPRYPRQHATFVHAAQQVRHLRWTRAISGEGRGSPCDV